MKRVKRERDGNSSSDTTETLEMGLKQIWDAESQEQIDQTHMKAKMGRMKHVALRGIPHSMMPTW